MSIYAGKNVDANYLFGTFKENELENYCPKIPIDCNLPEGEEGCITITVDPSIAPENEKGTGWHARVQCVEKKVVFPELMDEPVAGSFNPGGEDCEVHGTFNLSVLEQADGSECLDLSYTVSIDDNGSGLQVLDDNGDPITDPFTLEGIQVEEITLVATAADQIEQCVTVSFQAVCEGNNIGDPITQDFCLFAPSIVSSSKKIGFSPACQATITPETFLSLTCGFFTYTLNVFDDEGDRVGDEDAEFVILTEAGDYTVFVSDGRASVMCTFTVTDAEQPVCTSAFADEYLFCGEYFDDNGDNISVQVLMDSITARTVADADVSFMDCDTDLTITPSDLTALIDECG
ncbi:MAG: hypothetical protein AAFO94_19315, partial [Bacteroidota bacterium]